VKRVYLDLHGRYHPWLQRLAFFTIASAPAEFLWHVSVTAPGEIDCAYQVAESDMERFHKALDCYATYTDVIAQTKVHQVFDKKVVFELFREDHKPPLKNLCEGLIAK
jgi:N-acetylglucosamine malate deacetylase 2